jgi:hypothetical protein
MSKDKIALIAIAAAATLALMRAPVAQPAATPNLTLQSGTHAWILDPINKRITGCGLVQAAIVCHQVTLP